MFTVKIQGVYGIICLYEKEGRVKLMMDAEVLRCLVLLGLFLMGAVMGSFVCCQTLRLRLKEETGKELGNRSECFRCGGRIYWYDNIPIFSWLILKGKCRGCGEKIGLAEILSEIGLGMGFLLVGGFMLGVFRGKCGIIGVSCERYLSGEIGMSSLVEIILVVIFLISLSIMLGLWIYDAKWQRLPLALLTFLIICAIIYRLTYEFGVFLLNPQNGLNLVIGDLISTLMGVGILAGTYFFLYKISKEKWVGGGDYLLAFSIAVILGSWWLALIEMFVANLLATVVMLPQVKNKKKKVAFGPFLIIGFLIVYLLQDLIRNLLIGFS